MVYSPNSVVVKRTQCIQPKVILKRFMSFSSTSAKTRKEIHGLGNSSKILFLCVTFFSAVVFRTWSSKSPASLYWPLLLQPHLQILFFFGLQYKSPSLILFFNGSFPSGRVERGSLVTSFIPGILGQCSHADLHDQAKFPVNLDLIIYFRF